MIFDTIKEALLHNQFAQGGFVIAILSGAFIMLKGWCMGIAGFIKRRTLTNLEIGNGTAALPWMLMWLANHNYSKNARNVTATTANWGFVTNQDVVFVPGSGVHFFFYQGKLIWLTYVREVIKNNGMSTGQYDERMTIRVFPGNRKTLDDLVDSARREFQAVNNNKINIYSNRYDGWDNTNFVAKRSLESVILSKSTEDELIQDVKKFIARKDHYIKLNVPWRRGYLLYGEPGNGKSSFVLALASELNYNVYTVSITSVVGDQQLAGLINQVRENSILLIEDVDSIGIKRGNAEGVTSGVTLSGMLNAIDGVAAQNGRVLIMTTNKRDLIDSALIRSGRADKHVYVGNPNRDQVERMFDRFYENKDLAKKFAQQAFRPSICMADLQVFFLSKNTPEEALANCQELLVDSTPTRARIAV